ncbi:MAG TPA: hypothetical protein DG761_00260 [Gammaproteobacteria bacterium]|nr:hypothetical protein [Gammaproteobacteria bacterium]
MPACFAHPPFEDPAGTAFSELDLDAQGIGRHRVEGYSVVLVDIGGVGRRAGDRLEGHAVAIEQPPGIGDPAAAGVAVVKPIDFDTVNRGGLV